MILGSPDIHSFSIETQYSKKLQSMCIDYNHISAVLGSTKDDKHSNTLTVRGTFGWGLLHVTPKTM